MTALKILANGETETTLHFFEAYSGVNICILKPDFFLAIERLKLWQKDNFADNFTSQLFRLLCKADDVNKLRILVGFPAETIVYLLWYTSEGSDKFFEKYEELKNGNKK